MRPTWPCCLAHGERSPVARRISQVMPTSTATASSTRPTSLSCSAPGARARNVVQLTGSLIRSPTPGRTRPGVFTFVSSRFRSPATVRDRTCQRCGSVTRSPADGASNMHRRTHAPQCCLTAHLTAEPVHDHRNERVQPSTKCGRFSISTWPSFCCRTTRFAFVAACTIKGLCAVAMNWVLEKWSVKYDII